MVISDLKELIESDGEKLTDELIQLEAHSAETEADASEEPHEALERFTLNEVLFHDIAAGMARFLKSGL